MTQLTSVSKLHDYLVRGVYPCILPPMARWLSGLQGEVPDHEVCAPPHPERVFLELMRMAGALAPNDVVSRPYRGILKDEVLFLDLKPLYRTIFGVSLSTTDAVSIWRLIVRA